MGNTEASGVLYTVQTILCGYLKLLYCSTRKKSEQIINNLHQTVAIILVAGNKEK